MFLVPLILAGLSMLGPFSIDTPFPAFPAMAEDFDVTSAEMQLVVSAYLIAFGLMSPFHGPLSDALGRKPVIIGGVLLYAAASIGCALSPSLEMLLVFRVLQGLSAGGGVIVSRTIIRDVFEGAQAQRLMSRVMLIFAIAPAIAPVIGGALLQLGAWPIAFWFMAVVALLLITVVAFALPETHPVERRIPLRFGALARSLATVARSASFHRVAWAAALSFAGQFIYISSASIIVVDLLGLGELDFWILFAPLVAAVMVGSQISSSAAGRISGNLLVTGSLIFCVAAALGNIGIAAVAGPTLPWVVLGPALLGLGTVTAYPTMQLILLDMFPAGRGSSVSLFTFFTLLLNGLIAGLLAPLVTGSVLELAVASTLLVTAGLGCWLWHLALARHAARTPAASLPPAERV
ncbi:multidrug effflux MFS transporter [Nocardioides sp.]|uniref:multidrug effflux MFS transporter n=1 Tax=Nocardioides sp. TaxID=35761 RepID=UPI002ED18432